MIEGIGGFKRSTSKTDVLRLLSVLSVIFVLIPVEGLSSAVQVASGTVALGNSTTYGTTAYSVDYSYPATAEVGTNLTVAVTLHVNTLDGVIVYITGYRINVFVYIGAQLVGNGSVISALNAHSLYPGGTWGPNNVTIPLTASSTGLGKGQSADAAVSFILVNQDHIISGRNSFSAVEPPMQGEGGSLLILNQVPSSTTSSSSQGAVQNYLPEALAASGAVLMLLAVALWPRSPRGGRP